MAPQLSSIDLVERFQRGETQAFSLLFQKYRRRLAVLIHYKMGEDLRGRMEVVDILQEVFFAASRDLRGFVCKSPRGLMAWLSKIVDHAVVDAARHENREKRRPLQLLRFRSESNPSGPE